MAISGIGSKDSHILSNEVLNQQNLFRSFDKNKDRALDQNEFNEFTKTLGFSGHDLFKSIDKNQDGKISFNEFSKSMPEIKAEVFKKIDIDRNGKLDSKEIESFAKLYHLDPKKLSALFKADKDGNVGLEEFIKNFGEVLENPATFTDAPAESSTKSKKSKIDPETLKRIKTQLNEQRLQSQGSILANILPSQPANKIDFFW
ncbi:MAG: EF-hand domain-containing protein [Deltaproteobacteria bacterium]|nr:EF-hand domain-containing protein [Deltaproteobacteria bacterium]